MHQQSPLTPVECFQTAAVLGLDQGSTCHTWLQQRLDGRGPVGYEFEIEVAWFVLSALLRVPSTSRTLLMERQGNARLSLGFFNHAKIVLTAWHPFSKWELVSLRAYVIARGLRKSRSWNLFFQGKDKNGALSDKLTLFLTARYKIDVITFSGKTWLDDVKHYINQHLTRCFWSYITSPLKSYVLHDEQTQSHYSLSFQSLIQNIMQLKYWIRLDVNHTIKHHWFLHDSWPNITTSNQPHRHQIWFERWIMICTNYSIWEWIMT